MNALDAGMPANHTKGMTLVEIMVVIVILGLLIALSVPPLQFSLRTRQYAQAEVLLRNASAAFDLFFSEQGRYPANVAEMSDYYFPYFKIDWWNESTPIGGQWQWSRSTPFEASIFIAGPTLPVARLVEMDRQIDDGDLNTGLFRRIGSDMHYIVRE